MTTRRVLQVGIDPGVVDFSPYPGQNAEKLRSRIETAEAEVREAGFDLTVCQVPDDADAAEQRLRDCLHGATFDVVEIGSGLRTSHEYTPIFERVVGVIATLQPDIRFCFNDSPESTLEAIRRVTG